MARDKDTYNSGAAADKPSAGRLSRGESPAARPLESKGHRSGHGMESIRPHLRATLEERNLLRPTFPPEDPDNPDGWFRQ